MADDDSLRLPDGRRLGWRRYGPSGGVPVLYFHGWPTSRLEAQLLEPEAIRQGARVIAVDRPGYGLSDFQPGRRLLDWPADVTELADHLGLERFAVVGVSGGGPYAAVCAWALPERLTRVFVVNGLAPLSSREALRGMHAPNRALLRLARPLPQLGRPLLGAFAWTLRRGLPPILALPFAAGFAPVDREVLRVAEVSRTIYQATREAFRSGARGPAWEGRIYPRPWGFEPAEIRAPLEIWHGGADRNVPAEMGRSLHESVAGSRLRLYPAEGHLSLPYRLRSRILQELLR